MTTEYPRKGDHVKVTYEGVVTKADDALHRFFEIDGVPMTARGGVVEVLERTFKPGTVAARRTENRNVVRLRQTSGEWVSELGHVPISDDEIRALGYEIVYEPPA